ncbi:hypothetical protein QFC24_004107 [Naganishia onofrii]|uniref:Uncharacterized protein n=1 Tax=Naganishia onofrii TaxID=1851511 RepID=A0ACC2XF65_9TREE|nr:hypothetical protein QFC24_004107 [Naganishia onofrii]
MEKEISSSCPTLSSYKVFYEWEIHMLAYFRHTFLVHIIDRTEPKPILPIRLYEEMYRPAVAGSTDIPSEEETKQEGVKTRTKSAETKAEVSRTLAMHEAKVAFEKKVLEWEQKNEKARYGIRSRHVDPPQKVIQDYER